MKHITRAIFLGAFLALNMALWPKPAAAQSTQDFNISSFTADYYLNRTANNTATLHTVESITAVFPDFDQNHGILRAIPETYLDNTVNLKVDSVTDQAGNPQPYSTSDDGSNLVLRIGNPNAYVHGTKIYEITYDQRNVVSILSDHDEFYWDVNGDQWQQPFAQVTARLHIPANLAGSLQARRTCYVGNFGSTDTSGCTITTQTDNNGVVVTSQAGNLAVSQTMTIVNGFNQGTFKIDPAIARAKQVLALEYGVATLLVPVTAIFLYVRWRRYGRDPKGRGVIIPEYQPYKGLNVLTSDYIRLEKLNTKAISALVIELAVKHYLTIYEVAVKHRLGKDSTKYTLKLSGDPSGLSAEQQQALMMFFGDQLSVGSEVDLSTLKNSLASKVQVLKKSLGTSLATAGFFRSSPESAANTYHIVGVLLLVGGFGLIFVPALAPFCISGILSGVLTLIFGRYMPSRTAQGVDVHDYMLGLRDYIKLAEADRLKFLQSPQGAEKIQEAGLDPNDPTFKVKLFESLLPYAMIFNLEKDWSKQFENIYSSPPSWYAGNWNTFNAVYLATSLSNFSNFNSTNFSPPSSSGGSGFGGGFAGGGGGGGGGGGW